jgi:hypothetical protein
MKSYRTGLVLVVVLLFGNSSPHFAQTQTWKHWRTTRLVFSPQPEKF